MCLVVFFVSRFWPHTAKQQNHLIRLWQKKKKVNPGFHFAEWSAVTSNESNPQVFCRCCQALRRPTSEYLWCALCSRNMSNIAGFDAACYYIFVVHFKFTTWCWCEFTRLVTLRGRSCVGKIKALNRMFLQSSFLFDVLSLFLCS